MASISKEFDYIFITDPSDSLRCVICTEIAKDPKQCEDCGKLFCSECIEKNGKKPCPNCRTKNPRFFKDKRGARDIKELRVKCSFIKRGCKWTGTIGTLDKHLSTCQFDLVPCPNKCEENEELIIMKKDLENHLKTTCPNRAQQCLHCGEKGTYASITDHHKVCNKKLVPCPNKERGCPSSMERGITKWHVRSVCDYTEVACAYENLGCGVRMLRKDMKKHEKDDKVHIRLTMQTVSMREDYHITLNGEAMVFKLTEYSSKKKKNERFHCKPYYTHPGGYKMCIGVDVKGHLDSAGTHVSVFTKLLEGRYDNQLHWPFMGTVKYELLNQLTDHYHHKRISIFGANDDMQVGSSRSCIKFIPHSSLSHDPASDVQYLLDDTLYFRVSVTVDNHKPWLVCTDKINIHVTRAIKDNTILKDGEPLIFKMTGYKDGKSMECFSRSDSFYTSPEGYKMCIRVIPNGSGSGRGTHVSVHAALNEGAYDASLSWPFIGTVTVTLLNQLEDHNHHIKAIDHKERNNARVGTVTGYSQFISHLNLCHDPVKNTQYLKDDTLYFRITVTVDSHKSWLVCNHRIC